MTAFMDIYRFLRDHKIPYDRHDHPPVFTCDEATAAAPLIPGARTKNLFVRDEKGRHHFLVVVPPEKRVDMKGLSGKLGVKRLGFASAGRMRRYLALDPGSVTMLAVINDADGAVEVIVDRDLWKDDAFQCHPLVNTSTLVIGREDLMRFFTATGHPPRFLDVPARSG